MLLKFTNICFVCDVGVSAIRQVLLKDIKPAMILAKDVVDESGRVLVASETPLRDELIGLLSKHNVVSVWVKSDSKGSKEVPIVRSIVSNTTRLQLADALEKAFNSQQGVLACLPQIQARVSQVVDDLAARDYCLIYLNDIHYKSEYLFLHSVHVGLISIVIGIAMGLPRDEIKLLGLAGMLHDYGKTRIEREIIDKKGFLSTEEFQRIKQHSALGYNILRTDNKLDYRIPLAALQHHERPDGSGYPWGVAGEAIHPFARIVAVADVYDALTTDRVYRSRIDPWEAIAIINEGAGSQFFPEVVAAFNNVAVPYNVGTAVKLDNGLCGSVVRINVDCPSRPIIWTERGIINLVDVSGVKIISAV